MLGKDIDLQFRIKLLVLSFFPIIFVPNCLYERLILPLLSADLKLD